MATIHVIFDPTDKIVAPPLERRPKGMCFIALSVSDLIEDDDEIAAVTKQLATLLLEQMKTA